MKKSIIRLLKDIIPVTVALVFFVFVFACQRQEGTMEKAGKEADKAMEATKEAMKEAGKKIGEGMEATKEAVESAAKTAEEKAKE